MTQIGWPGETAHNLKVPPHPIQIKGMRMSKVEIFIVRKLQPNQSFLQLVP